MFAMLFLAGLLRSFLGCSASYLLENCSCGWFCFFVCFFHFFVSCYWFLGLFRALLARLLAFSDVRLTIYCNRCILEALGYVKTCTVVGGCWYGFVAQTMKT